jgi:hypothetical protein
MWNYCSLPTHSGRMVGKPYVKITSCLPVTRVRGKIPERDLNAARWRPLRQANKQNLRLGAVRGNRLRSTECGAGNGHSPPKRRVTLTLADERGNLLRSVPTNPVPQVGLHDNSTLYGTPPLQVLRISPASIERDWSVAKARLSRQMKRGTRGTSKSLG